MKIQAVIAHPRTGSFCHALFARAISSLEAAGHDLSVHDLYAENFDPVLKESEAYTAGDSIEKTLAKAIDPVVQEHREEIVLAQGEPDGLLKINSAVILNTSDTPPEREARVLGDPLRLIWENCVLPYCGVKAVSRRTFGPVAGSDARQRHEWLDEVDRLVSQQFQAS